MKSLVNWLRLTGMVWAISGCASDPGDNPIGGAGNGGTDEPVFAIESLVFGQSEGESSTSYVLLTHSLETQDALTLDSAREFPGYAPLDAIGGRLYAGSGEKPTITGFDVSDELVWSQIDTVSFGNFTSASIEGNVLVDAERGFVALNDKNYVSWNPSTLSIGSSVPLSDAIPSKRGALSVQRGYGHEIVGNSIYQPYYWSDDTFQSYSQQSQIALLDAAKNEFGAVMDAPCPHLHITTSDEDGNLYFSNGAASIASAVLDSEQPRNCMVRVNKGKSAIDSSFTVDFKELAEGREGSNFFYIGKGVGFFNVYHAERDDKSDPAYGDIMYSPNYHLWTLDLKTMSAKIMDGIDFTGGQYVAFHLAGRVFVAVPNGLYSSTAIYEVLANGTAEKRFDVQGWAFKMLQVR
ncbi:MAG TPA: hypothetical protein VGC79_24560 [Polyangiaceae bacterium]